VLSSHRTQISGGVKRFTAGHKSNQFSFFLPVSSSSWGFVSWLTSVTTNTVSCHSQAQHKAIRTKVWAQGPRRSAGVTCTSQQCTAKGEARTGDSSVICPSKQPWLPGICGAGTFQVRYTAFVVKTFIFPSLLICPAILEPIRAFSAQAPRGKEICNS